VFALSDDGGERVELNFSLEFAQVDVVIHHFPLPLPRLYEGRAELAFGKGAKGNDVLQRGGWKDYRLTVQLLIGRGGCEARGPVGALSVAAQGHILRLPFAYLRAVRLLQPPLLLLVLRLDVLRLYSICGCEDSAGRGCEGRGSTVDLMRLNSSGN
jgi:hypothetical protein